MRIRYYGHVGVPTGYGDAASEMCMAIAASGIDLEISTDGTRCHQRYLPLAKCIRNEADLSPPDVVIVHTLPLDCATVLVANRIRERYPKALCVAYTTWEGISRIPEQMAAGFRLFDHLWVPSQENYICVRHLEWAPTMDSFGSRTTPKSRPRVHIVPHPFDEGRWATWPPHEGRDHAPYRFYYIGAWTARKNVDGLVRAYLRAFDHRDPVELLIQSSGAAQSACDVAMLSTGMADGPVPVIRFSNRRMTDEEIEAIHHEAHCFVTATRGEAWNIPAFDAVLAGNHVISPAGLGSDDFLAGTSADRYASRAAPAFGDVRLVDAPGAPDGHAAAHYLATQGLTCRAEWREPNLIELAALMRTAYTNRTTKLIVDYDPTVKFGRRAVGRLIAQILETPTL